MKRRELLGAIGGIGVWTAVGSSTVSQANAQAMSGGPSATVRWAESFDRSASWTFESAAAVTDGAVVCGWESGTEPFTGEGVLAKLTTDGEIEWETTVTGSADVYALYDVTKTEQGYATIGSRTVRNETGQITDAQVLIVFDETGKEQWRQSLDDNKTLHSVFGMGDRVVVGRDGEFRQFLGQNDQARPVSIEQESSLTNDFVLTQPAAIDRHDSRMYAACTRSEGYVDDDGQTQMPLREPLLLELIDDPLRIINTHRIQFDRNHWVRDLTVTDDGYYIVGVSSDRDGVERDPDAEGWLLHVDFGGDRQWYETVSDETGLRFTGLEAHEAWDGLLVSGQTLDYGQLYLAGTEGGSIDRLYEQDEPGVLTAVATTEQGAAIASGAVTGRNDDPFAASIAVDPPQEDVAVTVTPDESTPGEPITFSAAVTGSWEPEAIEWTGDVNGTGSEIEHRFEDPGQYETTATVQTPPGGTVEQTARVSVAEPTDATTQDDGLPGFGIPAAIGGLAGGAAVHAVRSRASDSDPQSSE